MIRVLISTFTLAFVLAACGSKNTAKSDKMEKASSATEMSKKMDKSKKDMMDSAMSRTCSLKKDKRVIKVEKVGEGCDVRYTKFGETKSVASSANGMSHCKRVSEKIAVNLADAGFSCM